MSEDIDKKIAEMEAELDETEINMPNVYELLLKKQRWLIAQLKECREEINRLHEMESVELYRRLWERYETLEHRTKEACKEAIDKIDGIEGFHGDEAIRKSSAKQAIGSVGIKE